MCLLIISLLFVVAVTYLCLILMCLLIISLLFVVAVAYLFNFNVFINPFSFIYSCCYITV